MIADFQLADYALCSAAVIMSVTGLFRGFSGSLAFFAAVAAAVATAVFAWPQSADFTNVMWMRAGGVLVSSLLVFGIVRVIVKKTVNGLLAQPTDALMGFLTGAAFALLILSAWAFSGVYLEYSTLATRLSQLMTAYGL
jgi:uncharacterized membrane protein required for colicin V production